MTDNLKAFLEAASKDKELLEKLKTAGTPEAVIALAKEKGFDLTAEDLKQEPAPLSEISDDELEAVAGGKACACVLGGDGEENGYDEECGCLLLGNGDIEGATHGRTRCTCFLAGGGSSKNDGSDAKKIK